MANRKEDEKNERIIRSLLKLPDNRRCINCKSLGPQYVCTNFWTFICTTCSGIQCSSLMCYMPNNPDNLRKHAEQFQRQTPCSSVEAAGAAATTEYTDKDEGETSKVVPGNQEVMDQNASSNGIESIAIGPLNDDGSVQKRTERFVVDITEGNCRRCGSFLSWEATMGNV